MFRKLFLVCAFAPFIDLSAQDLTGVDFSSPSKVTAEVTHSQEFKDYFDARIDAELKALNIDPEQLNKERDAIALISDSTMALSRARDFYRRYLPYFERALLNMDLKAEALRTALIDVTESTDPSDFLNIIRYSYSCSSPLTLGLCNLLNNGRCTLETIRPGQFNIFPRREYSDRYQFDGNAQGYLFMHMENIDTSASRYIGAYFNSQNSDRMCVQTGGHLSDLFVSTSLDHYFFSGVFSLAFVKLMVSPADRTHFEPLLGTTYIAYRSEGLTNLLWDNYPEDRIEFGQTLPYRPYPVADELWITPEVANQWMSAAYAGILVQGYAGGLAEGRISFTLDEINILRILR